MLLPELGAYLIAQGVGTALGTDMFLGKLPPTPDAIVAIFEYASLADEPDLGVDGKNIRYEYPRVQIVCRGVRDDYATPRTTAQNAKKALMKVQGSTLTGTYYLAVTPESGPFFLRRDLNDRLEFVTNFQVYKGLSAS